MQISKGLNNIVQDINTAVSDVKEHSKLIKQAGVLQGGKMCAMKFWCSNGVLSPRMLAVLALTVSANSAVVYKVYKADRAIEARIEQQVGLTKLGAAEKEMFTFGVKQAKDFLSGRPQERQPAVTSELQPSDFSTKPDIGL